MRLIEWEVKEDEGQKQRCRVLTIDRFLSFGLHYF